MKVLHITNMYLTFEKVYFGVFVKEQIDSLVAKGVECQVTFVNGQKSLWNYIDIFRVSTRNVDVVHCHYGHTGTLALIRKIFERKPLIVSYCGSDILGNIGKDGKISKKSSFLTSINKYFSQYIDAAIVKSPELKTHIRADNIFIIPSGVDMEIFSPIEKAKACARLSINPEKHYILFLGVPAIPRKRYELFSDSLKIIKRTQKQTEELVLGGIEHSDMPYYINAADVAVLTSIHEGSPNVIKEAMACEIPVVSTDVGDVKELFRGCKGYFIAKGTAEDIAEKVLFAMNYKGKTENSRIRLRKLSLSMSQVATRIVEVYKSVI